jgi:hypothetical protein
MEKDLWEGIWKLKYVGKVMHFLWRFAHNYLALRLERRGMDLDRKCVMCGNGMKMVAIYFSSATRSYRYGRSWVWSLSELFPCEGIQQKK